MMMPRVLPQATDVTAAAAADAAVDFAPLRVID